MTAPARLKARSLEGEALELRYIDLDAAALWDRNPKRHDLGALAQSIRRYGFKDPPKWEPELGAEGRGGFAEGNGRTEVLRQMRDGGEDVPRGVLLHGEGRWAIPVLFGVDAASRAEAEAYGIDHNNLVVGGGDTSLNDFMRLWDRDGYLAILRDAALAEQAPVSMDPSDIEAILGFASEEASSSYEAASEPGTRRIELVLSETEHAAFVSRVEELGRSWQLTSRTEVVLRAVEQEHRQNYPDGA